MSVLNSFRRIITPAAIPTEQPPETPATPATPSRASRAQTQRSPLFNPSPSTSPSSLRRQRSQNFDRPDSLALMFSPPAQKRHKTFAREICREQALPQDALDDFAGLPSIPCMLISLQASLIVYKKQTRYAELVAMLDTKDFETRLKSRLTALLLSPNITAYVVGAAARVMDLVVENPEAFAVPPELFEHSDLHVKLASVVTAQLAQARGNIKQKLTLSLGRPGTGRSRRIATSNISVLCNSLAPRSSHMELRTVHWTRVAFLRATLVDFNQLNFNKKPDASSNDRESESREGSSTAERPTRHRTYGEGGDSDGQQSEGSGGEGRQPESGSDLDEGREPDGRTSAVREPVGSGEGGEAETGAGIEQANGEGEHGECEQAKDGADADEEEVYSSSQYWTYVDDQMAKLRTLLRKPEI
ncbi:hypothetical protein K466DRAFT_606045 [Polyporus arcularius HHB13444]|uniref:Uncharacterized protein n=1 Tax=Polyporus arcularius HHB13444 TaxID=1314778 RepID=A0A5C3P1I7_9APHY|nr:hypothetical protein K466DRAFT_606045 [Polyporus arcularius HHB13444]